MSGTESMSTTHSDMESPTSVAGPSGACCACGRVAEMKRAGQYALAPREDENGEPLPMEYPLAECSACGHVQADPPPDSSTIQAYYKAGFWAAQGADPTAEARSWHERVTEPSGMWERSQRADRQVRALVETPGITTTSRVIDLGSGWSPVLYQLQQLGFSDLHALEPSAEVCDFLDTQGVTTWPVLLEEFLERDDLPSFDAMIISHTVEHLVDPQAVVAGLRDLLAPDGVLYVDVPFRDDLRPHHEGLHLQFFNEQSMRRLLERSGLDAESIEVDHLRWHDRFLLSALHRAYGSLYAGKSAVPSSGRIESLHKWAWRPVRRALRLRVNVHISSQDLKAVARRRSIAD